MIGAGGLADLSARQLAVRLRRRDISPVEAVDAVVARIEAVDPAVGAVVTLAAERARARARELGPPPAPGGGGQPLWAVPVTVKDLTPTRGLRTTRGSAWPGGWGPDVDAVAVERLKAAGAIVVAKTNTSEHGWKAETSNRLAPPTLNPWDLTRTPGGSSGGAGAAVACGFGPIATGTDGAGSVRIPASFCGVVGFKPTFGAIPYWPTSAEQLSHLGPLTRTVDDAALAFEVMAGPDPRDPWSGVPLRATPAEQGPLRVGVVRDTRAWPVDPQIRAALDDVADRCGPLGMAVDEVDPLPDGYDALEVILAGFEAAPYRQGGLDADGPHLDPGRLAVVRRGLTLTAADLAAAVQRRAELMVELGALWARFDLLLTPATTVLPFEPGQVGPPGTDEVVGRLQWAAFSYPWNLTGDPACSLPAARSASGLPIGVQLVAARGDDRRLLAAARRLELAELVGYRPPPVLAAAGQADGAGASGVTVGESSTGVVGRPGAVGPW